MKLREHSFSVPFSQDNSRVFISAESKKKGLNGSSCINQIEQIGVRTKIYPCDSMACWISHPDDHFIYLNVVSKVNECIYETHSLNAIILYLLWSKWKWEIDVTATRLCIPQQAAGETRCQPDLNQNNIYNIDESEDILYIFWPLIRQSESRIQVCQIYSFCPELFSANLLSECSCNTHWKQSSKSAGFKTDMRVYSSTSSLCDISHPK